MTLRIVPHTLPSPRPRTQPFERPWLYDPSCVLALMPEINSKWLDYSGHGNDGTIVGATKTQGGRYNQALYFDGTTDYVNCGSPSSLSITSAFTISVWLYYTGGGGHYIGIVDQMRGSSSNGGLTLHIGDSGAQKVIAINADGVAPSPTFTTTANIPNNQWLHLVEVWDGTYVSGSIKIYFNTVKQAGVEINYGTPPATPKHPLFIGWVFGQDYLEGIIDEVFIFKRALALWEIKALYEQGRP